jgi:hypothetical protein
MLSPQYLQTIVPTVEVGDDVGMSMDDDAVSYDDDSDYPDDSSDCSHDSYDDESAIDEEAEILQLAAIKKAAEKAIHGDSGNPSPAIRSILLADKPEFAFKNKILERCDSAPLMSIAAPLLARMAKASPAIRAMLLDGHTEDEPEFTLNKIERCDSAPLLSMPASVLARMARRSPLLEDRWAAKLE